MYSILRQGLLKVRLLIMPALIVNHSLSRHLLGKHCQFLFFWQRKSRKWMLLLIWRIAMEPYSTLVRLKMSLSVSVHQLLLRAHFSLHKLAAVLLLIPQMILPLIFHWNHWINNVHYDSSSSLTVGFFFLVNHYGLVWFANIQYLYTENSLTHAYSACRYIYNEESDKIFLTMVGCYSDFC